MFDESERKTSMRERKKIDASKDRRVREFLFVNISWYLKFSYCSIHHIDAFDL